MSENASPEKQIADAINASDLAAIKSLFAQYPDKVHINSVLGPWVAYATQKADTNMINFLLDAGIDPNVMKKRSTANALAEAARFGRLDVVKLLHQRGAKMDTSEPTGNPLISTISSNSVPIAKFLLDEGLDGSVVYSGANYQGMTAASLALEGGAGDVARTIVLHLAKDDREVAQGLLLEAYDAVKRNNPDAHSYPPPPIF